MPVYAENRRRFAEELKYRAHLNSPRLLHAFATVPRERFVGEGPWRLRSDLVPEYWSTADADPAHLYHDVLVALDEARRLDNGLPSLWALLFDALAIREGEHVIHVGAGTEYYSAILSEVVGPSGRVKAIECDAELAGRAAVTLQNCANIEVIHGDGCRHDAGRADVIAVNAGVTHPHVIWLNSLAPDGRMLLPLTIDDRRGTVFMIRRRADCYDVRALHGIEIFPCEGARDLEGDARLRVAFWKQSGTRVNSLRRDVHDIDAGCWLHGEGFCMSRRIAGHVVIPITERVRTCDR